MKQEYSKGFDAVYGYDSVKEELCHILDCMNNIDKYKKLGATVPHGLLLIGAPGVGKTLLSSCFMKMSNRNQFVVDSSCRNSEICGRISSTFLEASKNQPSIILIDDCDKYASKEDREGTFRVLQNEIDKIKNKNVFVIGTANEDIFPASLKRSGRFDYLIIIQKPGFDVRTKFTQNLLDKLPLDETVKAEDVSGLLNGKSCADIVSFFNDVAISAAYRNADKIGIKDIVAAYTKTQSSDDVLDWYSDLNKELAKEIAYHEVGHLLVSEAIEKGSIGFVSIIDYKNRNSYCVTNKDINDSRLTLLVLLGGKVSYEMEYGKLASGCSDDLKKACDICSFNLSLNGTGGYNLLVRDEDSTTLETRVTIGVELHKATYIVQELIALNKGFIEEAVKLLISKGYILLSEIKKIEEKHPINNKPVVSFLNSK